MRRKHYEKLRERMSPERRQRNEAATQQMRLQLSGRDRDVFLSALTSPPEPNAKLRRAAEKHVKKVKGRDHERGA